MDATISYYSLIETMSMDGLREYEWLSIYHNNNKSLLTQFKNTY